MLFTVTTASGGKYRPVTVTVTGFEVPAIPLPGLMLPMLMVGGGGCCTDITGSRLGGGGGGKSNTFRDGALFPENNPRTGSTSSGPNVSASSRGFAVTPSAGAALESFAAPARKSAFLTRPSVGFGAGGAGFDELPMPFHATTMSRNPIRLPRAIIFFRSADIACFVTFGVVIDCS